MTDPMPVGDASALIAALEARMSELQQQLLATKSLSTLRAYRTDLRDFHTYCQAHEVVAVPAAPLTIALYLVELLERGNKPSTILRRHASISMAHQRAGHRQDDRPDIPIRPLLGALRRQLDYSSSSKAALDIADLRLLLNAMRPGTAAGARDRALLLLGFAGGLRSSELVALDVGDINVSDRRLRIRVPPDSVSWAFGRELMVPRGEHADTCPVRALRIWYALSGIRSGPIFRPIDRHGRVGATRLTDRAVAPVIKRAAQRAGLDPTRYAGHSFRAGFVVAAAAGGAPERVIMEQTGLRSRSALRRYPPRWSRLDRGAAAYLGL